MSELTRLINRKVTFHCSRRGGKEGRKDFKVVNSISGPLVTERVPDWVTPSLLEIYEYCNGLKLFQPSLEANEGFKLYSVDEVSTALDERMEIIEENLEDYKESSDFEDL